MLEVSGLDVPEHNPPRSWPVQDPCDRFGRVLREGSVPAAAVSFPVSPQTHTHTRTALLIDPSARSALQQTDTDGEQMFRRGYRGGARLPPTL